MIKSKKQMFIVISVFTLILLLGTTTYAFFNYTRTGTANVIKVGRISFITRQTNSINLTNLFPIDPTDTTAMNDDTKVGTLEIEIEGDTDYADGIEYLVSSVDSNIYTNQGQIVPISLDVTVNGLGTPNANYFTSRESKNANTYKKLVGDTLVGDQMLLVGYITKNNPSGIAAGINGSITIKAYLNKNKILISDTYDGTESDNMGTTNNQANSKTVITTSEWNALQQNGISFKVKVEANEGIWVTGSLEEIMRKSAVMDNISSTNVSASTGIVFGSPSNNTNGKGVYTRAGTENDAYPIMYYRGAVEDNNVLFANKCWKAVRTTDTGGVKLIYNGELSPVFSKEYVSSDVYDVEQEGDKWIFDATDSTWDFEVNDGKDHEISFKVPAGDDYFMQISGTTGSSCGLLFYALKNESIVRSGSGGGGATINVTASYGTLTASDELKLSIYGASDTSQTCSVNMKIKMQQGTTELSKNDYRMLVEKNSGEYGCDNSGEETQITLNESGTDINTFVFSGSNLYTSPAYSGYMYGDVYTYNSGVATSGAYFGSSFTWNGVNYKLVDPITTKNNTHHYTCNQTTADGTCTTLRYYYYQNYYVNLTGGDGIEQAIEKMQTNTHDSNAKNKIDAWYASNMSEFTNKLEDTIWCNDRSFGDNNNNGWIANGGDLETYIYYGAYQRSSNATNTSTVKNQPSLVCANKNDRFTVNNGNGNGALTYPTALLTEDEIVLAGGIEGLGNGLFYLTTGASWWSLSPFDFTKYAYNFNVQDNGGMYNGDVHDAIGLRPAISIKPGQLITKGTGTVSDPYVIE